MRNGSNMNSTTKEGSWTHNKIQTNRTNPPRPDKVDSKTAKERNVNASGANRKRNKVAGNKAAVSPADDKADSLGTIERREATPAVSCFEIYLGKST